MVLILDAQYSTLAAVEKNLLPYIEMQEFKHNLDNISRTEAYLQFYQRYPEIKWAFLAHMVSRNAGWNMCDLEGKWLTQLLNKEKRNLLYHTYERANWLIFHDAYPQLLLYHYSTKMHTPMFHLLKFFHVSQFMVGEWERFWKDRDEERLLVALIINEQNVIQKPVILDPLYKKKVFHTFLFSVHEWLHNSYVLFPTVHGELFGASVYGFNLVDRRIELGKRLASILFEKALYPHFYQFAVNTIHTGSRYDYEQYLQPVPARITPELRQVFSVIRHSIQQYEDWTSIRRIKKQWFTSRLRHQHSIRLTDWYKRKKKSLHRGIQLKNFFTRLLWDKKESLGRK